MLGLFFLVVIVVYLILFVTAIRFAARWAEKNGRRPWVWRIIAGLVMYNLVFWDLVPSVLAHRYYCEREEGLWVYKYPKEWLKDHPSLKGTLKNYESMKVDVLENDWTVIQFNDRLRSELSPSRDAFLAVARVERLLRDIETNEILLRSVQIALGSNRASFHSGGSPEAWRRSLVFGWLGRGYCDYQKADGAPDKFRDIKHEYYQIGELE